MNLDLILYLCVGLTGLGLAVYCLLGSIRIRADETREPGPLEPVPVSIIMPFSAPEPDFEAGLESILAQDYEHFELLLVAESEDDPLWGKAARKSQEDGRIRVFAAGPARSCGQKNRNLVAGLDRADPDSKIIVFTDAGGLARPDWLRNLIAPLVSGEAGVSSGYHHFIPWEGGLGGSAKALCVLLLLLARSVPFLGRAWGGATALTREALEKLKVREAWSETVVDDAVLARLQSGSGLFPTRIVNPRIITRDLGETLRSFDHWLTRQMAFYRTILPGDWLFIGLAALALNLSCLGSLAAIIIHMIQGQAPFPALAGAAYLVLFSFLSLVIRKIHPRPGPVGRWYGAVLGTVLLGPWCFFKTCLSTRITWRGRVYRVGRRGRVEDIQGPS